MKIANNSDGIAAAIKTFQDYNQTNSHSNQSKGHSDMGHGTSYVPSALKKQTVSAAARTQMGDAKTWSPTKSQTRQTQYKPKVIPSSRTPIVRDMNRQRVKGLSRHKRKSITDGPELFVILTFLALGGYLISLIQS